VSTKDRKSALVPGHPIHFGADDNLDGMVASIEDITSKIEAGQKYQMLFNEKLNQNMAEDIGIKGFLTKPVVQSDPALMVRKVLDNSKGRPDT
jgi:hypothetical protein